MKAHDERWDICFPVSIVTYPKGVVTFRGEAIRKDLQTLREAGVRWVMTGGINLWDAFERPVEEIVRTAGEWTREAGMKISSCHCAGPTYAMLERSQDAVVANLLRTVDLFAPLGFKAFVLHAGWLRAEPEDVLRLPDSLFASPECDRIMRMHAELVAAHGEDVVIAAVGQNLKAMAKAARSHGIALAFENLGDMLPLSGRATLEKLVWAVDEPNAGYCLDSGHAWMRGDDPAQMARWMGERLFETHFHDCRGGSRIAAPEHGEDEHLPVGFGTIDWRRLIQALDEIAFPGPITFETGGWSLSGDPVTSFQRAIEWWCTCEKMALNH